LGLRVETLGLRGQGVEVGIQGPGFRAYGLGVRLTYGKGFMG